MMFVLGILIRKVIANRTRLIFLEGFLFLLKAFLFYITYTYAVQVGSTWVWIMTSVVGANFFIYNPISNFTWGYTQESKLVSKMTQESLERLIRLEQEHERLLNIDNESELMDCVRRARASIVPARPLGPVMQEFGATSRGHSGSIEMCARILASTGQDDQVDRAASEAPI